MSSSEHPILARRGGVLPLCRVYSQRILSFANSEKLISSKLFKFSYGK